MGNSLTTPSDQPVVLHRYLVGCRDDLITVIIQTRGPTANSQNPFGSTYCHGYQNLIFEVSAMGQLWKSRGERSGSSYNTRFYGIFIDHYPIDHEK